MEEQVEQVKQVKQMEQKMNKNISTSSKYEGLAAELMIGFWFRVGVVLAVKMLESLKYCIRRKC